MKKLFFALLALCLAGTACRDKEPNGGQEYPKDIAFTEYSLDGISCQWKNFEYDYSKLDNSKILIINGNEELRNYIECTEIGYPEIDFSKQTLIIAWGVSANQVGNIKKQLIQTENNQYNFNVVIEFGPHETLEKWIVSVVTNKLSNNDAVALSTEYSYPLKTTSL